MAAILVFIVLRRVSKDSFVFSVPPELSSLSSLNNSYSCKGVLGRSLFADLCGSFDPTSDCSKVNAQN